MPDTNGEHTMLQHLIVQATNRLLDQNPWAMERLAKLAPMTLCIRFGSLPQYLGLSSEGLFCAPDHHEAAVTFSFPASVLGWALVAPEQLMSQASIKGPADKVEALGFVFRQLRWDTAEAIAPLVGDIAATRLVEAGENIRSILRNGFSSTVKSVADYCTYESGAIIDHGSLASFSGEVDALRDDLARLEKRISKL